MEIANEKRAEKLLPKAILVCSKEKILYDNIKRKCYICKEVVWIRPYNKKALKFVCKDCYFKDKKLQKTKPFMSKRGLDEVAEWIENQLTKEYNEAS